MVCALAQCFEILCVIVYKQKSATAFARSLRDLEVIVSNPCRERQSETKHCPAVGSVGGADTTSGPFDYLASERQSEPGPVRSLVVKKGSKTVLRCSGAIPLPSSETRTNTPSVSFKTSITE